MDERKYELLLAETAAELPPVDSELSEPWSHAMRLILWGLALVTFRLGLLGLQYILPCVGSVLVFLGFRSLRRSARGFAIAYAASVVQLVMHALGTAADAVRPEYFGSLGYFFFAAYIALDFTLLLGLRSGIRSAFPRRRARRRATWRSWPSPPTPESWLSRCLKRSPRLRVPSGTTSAPSQPWRSISRCWCCCAVRAARWRAGDTI